jgi:hypothetical protein
LSAQAFKAFLELIAVFEKFCMVAVFGGDVGESLSQKMLREV